MYLLELHGMALPDGDGVGLRSFERQIGGTSGFKSLAAVESRLIELSEDLDTDWENAFAVSKDGVDAHWWRLADDRTGGATDLRLGYAPSDYKSAHYVHSDEKLLCQPWDGRMTLKQADAWAIGEGSNDPKLSHIVLLDRERRRIAAAWVQAPEYKGIEASLCLIAIGEHIV